MRRPVLTLVFALATQLSAPAIVFWNLGNDANQTDPGTGVPWNSVAKVVNTDNSFLSGSAVYLGNGFLLTANHVTVNSNFSKVTFDNTNFFSIDPNFGSYGTQVAPGVDMKVIKLTLNPAGVNAVTLLSTPVEMVAPATLVGWGKGRDPAVPLASTSVTWGSDSTAAKRWGVNVPKIAGTSPYDFIATIAGATGPGFFPSGVGDAEASATLYDSGSGLFQQIGGQWYLIGLTTAVETNGSSTYGDDDSTGGDLTYYARISSYEQDITALVPEPSSISLLAMAGAAMASIALRRRR